MAHRLAPAILLATVTILALAVQAMIFRQVPLGESVVAAAPIPPAQVGAGPVVSQSVRNDTSPELRTIPPKPDEPDLEPPENKSSAGGGSAIGARAVSEDPVVQRTAGNAMPAVRQSFPGSGNGDQSSPSSPPDMSGAIGPGHYVQMTNNVFVIFDRAGTRLYGPAANNTLWTGFGGPCEATNDGDPIALYDRLAGRWFLTQFSQPNGLAGPFHQCVAVSATSDPLGAYYRYDFLVSADLFNDYGKVGIWPDGYYFSFPQFEKNRGPAAGAGLYAVERDKMLVGQAARTVYFDVKSTISTTEQVQQILPSDLDGLTLPPPGSPNYFVTFADDEEGWPLDQLLILRFHVDWTNPLSSTLTGPATIPTAAFSSNLCNFGAVDQCLPQRETAQKLDALPDRPLFRLAYRNDGDHESLVFNHTVNAGSGQAGIRWYELRDPGGAPRLQQQGTFALADGLNRFVGSIASDRVGNLALGYSATGDAEYPSIRYAGRLVTETLGTLGQGEGLLVAGGGSQAGSYRWGDYSQMTLDPLDDCTFWYTTEYFTATLPDTWTTRIASFRYPSCSAVITALSPLTIPVGSPGVTLTVTGSTFQAASTVRWNGADRPTTFVSATRLLATIPASDLAIAGPISVTVASPAPETAVSPVFAITVAPARTYLPWIGRSVP